jgi:hypothetical protein
LRHGLSVELYHWATATSGRCLGWSGTVRGRSLVRGNGRGRR